MQTMCPPESVHSSLGEKHFLSWVHGTCLVKAYFKAMLNSKSYPTAHNLSNMIEQHDNLCFWQNSDGKGDSKGKKTPNKPLKILEEDDEDLSALKDPSEKVSWSLTS